MKEATSANVIKSGKPAKGRVLKHRTLAAKAEAEDIIEKAKDYAGKVAEKAEEAAQKAFEDAKKKGEEEALEKFHTHVLAAVEMRSNVFREAERDILRLSVKLAEKIIGRELQNNRETVVDIVTTALQHARLKQKLLIKVNPADLSVAEMEIEKFKSFSRSQFIDITADPRVGAGGCLIESEVGTVDARLETQFRVLKNALLAKAEAEGGITTG